MELDQILQLIDKVSDSSLTAFDYEADGIKIAMEHGKAAPVQVQMSGVPSGAGLQMAEMMGGANGVTAKEAAMPERKETAGKSTAAEDHSEAEEGVFVTSPLVGTFYTAPAEDAEPFVKVGDTVTASIDTARRQAICRAHSATHLLDAALKRVLGDHAHQAGSLVEPDRLRFDFTHFESITPEQLAEIDRLVNDEILAGEPIVTETLPIEEAKKRGAIALFGEKYGETVRVVEMGDFSVEFCGGTHLDNTAKTGVFRIKSEGSVASGVRRIEATVGRQSLETMNRNQELLFQAAQVLKTTPGELAGRAEQQMQEMKQLRSALEKFKAQASLGEATQFLMAAKELGGLKVLTANRSGLDANEMRRMGDFLRDKEPGVVGVLASVNGEKVSLLAVCGKEAVAKGIKAGDIIKAIAPIVGGRGGGKPDSAMGGGTELLKIDDALAAVDDFVAGKLGL